MLTADSPLATSHEGASRDFSPADIYMRHALCTKYAGVGASIFGSIQSCCGSSVSPKWSSFTREPHAVRFVTRDPHAVRFVTREPHAVRFVTREPHVVRLSSKSTQLPPWMISSISPIRSSSS